MAFEIKSPEAEVVANMETYSDGDDHHQSGEITWREADERRIRQRMDWRIVPTVLALYLMCFIDRLDTDAATFLPVSNTTDIV
jgi:hypothetical protein